MFLTTNSFVPWEKVGQNIHFWVPLPLTEDGRKEKDENKPKQNRRSVGAVNRSYSNINVSTFSSLLLHFTAEQGCVPARLSASHLASSVVSLILLASPNLTTHDIPPPSHRCNSHAWYGPALYLKMSVSPPAFSMCEARWRLRGERVRRSTAVQINECTTGG